MSKKSFPVEDELRDPTPEESEYLRKQGDPYAKLSVTLRDSGSEKGAPNTSYQAVKDTVSKDEFDRECRRIFGFYIPAVEKGRLRQHHMDFIHRNVSRSPKGRHRILYELRKYDVSRMKSLETRFNRGEDLTETKLRQIEQIVGPDKSDE